jgi:DNA modification methylase
MIQKDLLQLAHSITELTLLPGNPRRGDIEAVKRSLEAFGQRKPIVVRRSDNVVIAGNHTLQAAQALGWDEIAVVWVDDDEVTSKAFALADNRTAELGDYDEEALADLINDVGSLNPGLLESSGWDDKAVQELLDRVEQIELPADVDDVPEDVPAISKLGDVWLLGDHRVMCADSFIAELPKCDAVISDPPYGMKVDVSWYGGQVGESLGGKRIVKSTHKHKGKLDWDVEEFNPSRFAAHSKRVVLFGANYFCTALPENGSWWVWDKRTTENGDVQNAYGMPFELIWFKGKHAHKIIRHLWAGFTRKAETADKERLHPTQKPIAVMREIIEYLTENDEIILDPFGGSGGTLIAAHETNRIAYLIEFDPHYVDVICARFQKLTGVLPVLESSGKVHDFLNA